MAEVYLNPAEFQKQIDSYRQTTDAIKEMVYSLDSSGLKLGCIDRLEDCISELNAVLHDFGEMAALDTENMKLIKAKWMNADGDMAAWTLGEILFGKNT